MTATGLVEIENLSALFLQGRQNLREEGSCLSVFLAGRRCMAVEVQALVGRSPYVQARRVSEGADSRRLQLLVAVMDKFLQLKLSDHDIFLNITGGLDGSDPALDLAILAAVFSSHHGCESTRRAFVGEIGLQGEVRRVRRVVMRLKELESLGLESAVIPAANLSDLEGCQLNIDITPVATVEEAVRQMRLPLARAK